MFTLEAEVEEEGAGAGAEEDSGHPPEAEAGAEPATQAIKEERRAAGLSRRLL